MKNKKRNILLFAIGFFSLFSNASAETWETYPDTWVAVDELGRNVATSDEGVSREKVDPNATIGMFYYLWQGMHTMANKDITELLKADPDNPDWGPDQTFHWGSKPWLGYYTAGDKYVVAKHLQMLVDAGVDFLFFDATNAFVYPTRVQIVMAEIDRREANGMKSPKLAFMVHSNARVTAENIYNQFYTDPKYDKYWYYYDGKPLLLGPLSEIALTNVSGLVSRFTFRNSWAWMGGGSPNEWAWLENYPQNPGWTYKFNEITGTNLKVTEQISVSVAQHATTKIGKSFHNGKEPAYDKYGMCKETPYGLYFQEQWDRAIAVHPPLVMVTQFNEWIAQRFIIQSSADFGAVRPGATAKIGESYFVDVYNGEFSRDIEPSTHPDIRDNYYLQMVSNARKYRGVNKIPVPTVSMTIDVNGDFSQWDKESVEYRDDKGDSQYSSSVQTEETRERKTNDIIRAKVTQDNDNYYFYVQTLDNLTDFATSKYWMRLFLNTDTNYSTGWGGYDYMVYKDAVTGKYSLMKNVGNGFKWETVGEVSYKIDGSEMQLAISKTALGDTGKHDIDFKWADNITDNNPDIMTFISDGDVAPNGRFNYRYKGSLAPAGVTGTTSDKVNFKVSCLDGKVTFLFDNCDNAQIQIYDVAGQLKKYIKETSVNHSEVELAQGFYLIKYNLDGKLGVEKYLLR